MSHFVVDASVAAKWFFDEIHTDAAERLLDIRHHLYAPDIFLIELDNLVCKRIRRSEITKPESRKIRNALRTFPVQVRPSGPLLDPAFELAIQTHRSLYDCIYLALAMGLDAHMITANRKFYNAIPAKTRSSHLTWIADLE